MLHTFSKASLVSICTIVTNESFACCKYYRDLKVSLGPWNKATFAPERSHVNEVRIGYEEEEKEREKGTSIWVSPPNRSMGNGLYHAGVRISSCTRDSD